MIRASREVHTFETDHGAAKIPLYDILWAEETCEGAQLLTRLHLADRVVTCRKSLDELLSLPGNIFLFCLISGAVNQLRIRSFEDDKIVMDNGEKLAISPFLSDRFRQQYCGNLAHWVWED